MRALIVAGGFGTRLNPFTKVIPKPLMPLGDQSLLERHVWQLHSNGIEEIFIAIHYCEDLFRSIASGLRKRYDLPIRLIHETKPCGTFGAAISLCTRLSARRDNSPLLVLNADIVSDINIGDFYQFYINSGAKFAVVLNDYSFRVPYGVVDSEMAKLVSVREKPLLHFPILAGYYIMKPSIFCDVSFGTTEEIGVDQVISALLQNNIPVATYQHSGRWIDAGTIDDLNRANEIFGRGGLQ